MDYWRTLWRHDDPDEPTEFLSEVGADLYEVRRVDIYRDGRLVFTDEIFSSGTTELSDQRMDRGEDLSEEVDVLRISKNEFENIWLRAKRMHEDEAVPTRRQAFRDFQLQPLVKLSKISRCCTDLPM